MASTKQKPSRAIMANNGRSSRSSLPASSRASDKGSQRRAAIQRPQGSKRLHVDSDPISRRRALGGLPKTPRTPYGTLSPRVITTESLIVIAFALFGIGAIFVVDRYVGLGALIGFSFAIVGGYNHRKAEVNHVSR